MCRIDCLLYGPGVPVKMAWTTGLSVSEAVITSSIRVAVYLPGAPPPESLQIMERRIADSRRLPGRKNFRAVTAGNLSRGSTSCRRQAVGYPTCV